MGMLTGFVHLMNDDDDVGVVKEKWVGTDIRVAQVAEKFGEFIQRRVVAKSAGIPLNSVKFVIEKLEDPYIAMHDVTVYKWGDEINIQIGCQNETLEYWQKNWLKIADEYGSWNRTELWGYITLATPLVKAFGSELGINIKEFDRTL